MKDMGMHSNRILERNLAVSLYGLYGHALEQEHLQCLPAYK